MKKYILLALVFLFQLGFAQKSNELLERDFWKTSPNVGIIIEKIAEGNDPTELNRFMVDPVVYAILENAPNETIEYLLTLPGNEVDKITHDGRNYLLWAGYKGNFPLIKKLIDMGSDVNLVDEHGLNLPVFTAWGGVTNPEIYEFYESKGIDLVEPSRDGTTALMAVAPHVKDYQELLYFINKGMDIHAKDNEGSDIFFYASKGGNTMLLSELIKKGIPFDGINKEGENAFFAAAMGRRNKPNDVKVFDYLIKLGLDPTAVNKAGKNVLHYLAGNNSESDIYELLLQNQVNPNQADEKGMTPLMIAAKYGNEKSAQILLPYVKNINQADDKGKTALNYAFAQGGKDLANILLKRGALLSTKDKEGETLVNVIYENYNPRNKEFFEYMNELLQKNNIKPGVNSTNGNNLYHTIAKEGNVDLLEYAKVYNVDLNQLNSDGLSPLHVAAMKAKDLKMLKAMVEMGADKRLVTEFGENAYILATENEMINKDLNQLKFLK